MIAAAGPLVLVWCGLLLPWVFISCTAEESGVAPEARILFAAYSVPKQAYHEEIIPAFCRLWKRKTGQTVVFAESYEASGVQSRAIADGLEADIAALSLEPDMELLRQAGLITHDWKRAPGGGFVTRSVVVIAYRPGNPRGIRDWSDLQREEVSVLYPHPKTSGGAMWAVNAIYGAGLKMSAPAGGAPDKAFARSLLKSIQRRVISMDKSGRMSVTAFENGIGDALVTYENEALLRRMQGRQFPFIMPRATLLIENPVALIDVNADRHGNRAVAEAFIDFLYTRDCQLIFSRYGFRPCHCWQRAP